LLFHYPTPSEVERFRAAQEGTFFSYPEVGASRHGQAPAGYRLDHNRVHLGKGDAVFARAVAAVRHWRMFDLGWVELFPPDAPLAVGTTVAILVHHYGFWSLNAARIVYLIEDEGPVVRFGFAYGTLGQHGERGEERFMVTWNHADDTVEYDLLAFSRPQHPLARLGRPLARRLQKRFARDSLRSMALATR